MTDRASRSRTSSESSSASTNPTRRAPAREPASAWRSRAGSPGNMAAASMPPTTRREAGASPSSFRLRQSLKEVVDEVHRPLIGAGQDDSRVEMEDAVAQVLVG